MVEATDSEVLYEHVIGTTSAGELKLLAHRLKPRFPAVVKHKDAWYFAGDFVDTASDLGNPENYGLAQWRARTVGSGGGGPGAEDGYFWGFYVPIVSRLFASRAK